MITVLILIAFFIIFGAFVRWVETPTKNYKPLNYRTHKLKKIKNVYDLIFPKYE